MAKQGRQEKSKKSTKKRITPKMIDRGGKKKPLKKEQPPSDSQETFTEPADTRHEIQGILFGALSVLLFVSLITYHPEDMVSLAGPFSTQNITGVIGAVVSDFLFRLFGYLAHLFPLLTLGICVDKFRGKPDLVNYGTSSGFFIAMLAGCALLSLPAFGRQTLFSPGGFVGVAVAAFLISYFSTFGSIIVITTGIITAAMLFKKYLFDRLMPSRADLLVSAEKQAEQQGPIIHGANQPSSQSQSARPAKKFTDRITGQFKKKLRPTVPNLVSSPRSLPDFMCLRCLC